MDEIFIWILVIIAILTIVTIFLFSIIRYLVKRRKSGQDHIQLYFDENFRKIMDEWDFVTRDHVKDFKKSISKRLSIVGGDINQLEKNRSKLDKRLGSLDREMTRLEGL